MSKSQRAKKLMRFDSLGMVDFAIGLVNSVLNFPGGQVNFFFVGGGGGEANRRRENCIRAMRKSSRLHGKGSISSVI